MSAWLLRPNLAKMFSSTALRVVVLEVDVQGNETEIERLSLARENPLLPSRRENPFIKFRRESVLEELVQNQISKGRRRLILDLGTLAKVDSTGVGEIAAAINLATKSGAELVLANMRSQPRAVFRLVELDSKIPVYESDREAAGHFGS